MRDFSVMCLYHEDVSPALAELAAVAKSESSTRIFHFLSNKAEPAFVEEVPSMRAAVAALAGRLPRVLRSWTLYRTLSGAGDCVGEPKRSEQRCHA